MFNLAEFGICGGLNFKLQCLTAGTHGNPHMKDILHASTVMFDLFSEQLTHNRMTKRNHIIPEYEPYVSNCFSKLATAVGPATEFSWAVHSAPAWAAI